MISKPDIHIYDFKFYIPLFFFLSSPVNRSFSLTQALRLSIGVSGGYTIKISNQIFCIFFYNLMRVLCVRTIFFFSVYESKEKYSKKSEHELRRRKALTNTRANVSWELSMKFFTFIFLLPRELKKVFQSPFDVWMTKFGLPFHPRFLICRFISCQVSYVRHTCSLEHKSWDFW